MFLFDLVQGLQFQIRVLEVGLSQEMRKNKALFHLLTKKKSV